MNIVLIFAVLVLMLPFGQKERKVWCLIQPLVTTRDEVDALLGRPTSGADNFFSYDTKDEHISMWFGGGKPNQADPCKWKVEKNIVFVYIVAPRNKLLLSEADIDLTKFKKENDFHGVNSFYYYDEVNGITVSTRIRDGEEVLESSIAIRNLSIDRNFALAKTTARSRSKISNSDLPRKMHSIT